MQRHLAAFEAHFVEAAGTRLLPLVAAARGLARSAADAATHTLLACLEPAAGLILFKRI